MSADLPRPLEMDEGKTFYWTVIYRDSANAVVSQAGGTFAASVASDYIADGGTVQGTFTWDATTAGASGTIYGTLLAAAVTTDLNGSIVELTKATSAGTQTELRGGVAIKKKAS